MKCLTGGASSKEARDTKATVTNLLRSWKEPWILGFDNYDSPQSFQNLTSFFPGTNEANESAILVTSRHVSTARLGKGISLAGLSKGEGMDLLLSRSLVLSKTDVIIQELEEGRQTIKKLGYLALAIDQAAAYISIRQLLLHMFMQHFEHRKEFILRDTPKSFWEYRTSDEPGGASQNLSVSTTWKMSFNQISETEEARTRIGEFLMQSAFFHPGSIGEELFSNFHNLESSQTLLWKPAFETAGAWDTFKFQDVVVDLVNLSLVQALDINRSGVNFSLHPLIKVRSLQPIYGGTMLNIQHPGLATASRRPCCSTVTNFHCHNYDLVPHPKLRQGETSIPRSARTLSAY